MKKFFISFALFAVLAAMALMISCGGNSSSGGSSVSNFGKLGGECYPNETCDEGLLCDTENNICVEDPENPVQDSDTSSEQTNDNVDTAYEQNDDKTDTLPENDNDSADDGDTIDPDTTDSGETDGETRVQDCTGLPENAEWNTVSSITQRWDGEKWVPSAVASFNFEGSENECRFKCVSGYTWDGSQCVQSSDPCNPNPCINMPNSQETCIIIDSTSYVCKCDSGYEWNGTSCVVMTREIDCTPKPENAVWNTVSRITQTYDSSSSSWTPSTTSSYNETGSTSECRFKCASAEYTWNGITCASNGSSTLPECNASSGTPCRDSSSGLIWSARASSTYKWQNAVNYCSSYSEGGLSGWHLPTISELRTLIQNCSATQTGGSCGVTDSCLSYSDCRNDACSGCSSDSTGKYSKFGEIEYFWSSSIRSDDSRYAWYVAFGAGAVGNAVSIYFNNYVRCVR